VRLDDIKIEPAVNAFAEMLTPHFENRAPDLTEENIQARIRGVSLMAISQQAGSDGADHRQQVGDGGRIRHPSMATCAAAITPSRTSIRPTSTPSANGATLTPVRRAAEPDSRTHPDQGPSAELRPDQTDQDSLPPYEILDAILHGLVEEEATLDEIVARGYDPDTVERVQRLLYNSEYKRRQAAPG